MKCENSEQETSGLNQSLILAKKVIFVVSAIVLTVPNHSGVLVHTGALRCYHSAGE